MALRTVLRDRNLTPRHAQDLLTAFRMDVTKLRYRDWDDLMGYCSYSAMPVGRFVLDVHGEDRSTWPANDALCAALQVINHLQDCKKDYLALNRVYLPQDALAAAGATVEDLGREQSTPALRACLKGLAERTGRLLDRRPLGLQGRLRDAVRRDGRYWDEVAMGILRDDLGQWQQGEAAEWFRTAIDLTERGGIQGLRLAALWESYASACQGVKPYREVEEALERARALRPRDLDYLRHFASLCRVEAWARGERARAGPLDEADRLYAEATRTAPGLTALWIEWAHVDVDRGRLDEARAKLHHAQALAPNHAALGALREVLGDVRLLDGGLALAAMGTHPWDNYLDQHIINTEHYRRLERDLRWVAQRNNTWSLHVHMGIQGADRAIAEYESNRKVMERDGVVDCRACGEEAIPPRGVDRTPAPWGAAIQALRTMAM